MKLLVERYSMKIIPENKVEEAYIEEVLGLKKEGDKAVCKRVNAMGLSCVAYLKVEKNDKLPGDYAPEACSL